MTQHGASEGLDTAIITGGTGNLGQVVTERFLEAGYRVCIPWIKEQQWDELRASLPAEQQERCIAMEANLTDEARVERMVSATEKEFGHVGCLLNLAGAFAFGENVWEMKMETWQKMLAVNLTSVFLCCKHALGPMRRAGRGRIINVSSKACEDIQPGASAYAVSKGGILTLTRALREELKDTEITVNAIMPSVIDTPVTRKIMPAGDPEKWVKPAEIADILLSLCGDGCRAVSGSTLRLFGGL